MAADRPILQPPPRIEAHGTTNAPLIVMCLSLAALRMALRSRTPGPGLVHHSDRGIQYASGDYTDLLKDNKVRISMSGKGNPYDNATCESFMKTLKYEEVYRQEYSDMD